MILFKYWWKLTSYHPLQSVSSLNFIYNPLNKSIVTIIVVVIRILMTSKQNFLAWFMYIAQKEKRHIESEWI